MYVSDRRLLIHAVSHKLCMTFIVSSADIVTFGSIILLNKVVVLWRLSRMLFLGKR